jgi:pimeloyl-ACP methyl ester carboxylesterase
MELEPKMTRAGGIKVSYYDLGENSGLPIIFIHGFPFSKSLWKGQLTYFSKTHRVIAYDVRGHGATEPGEREFTMEQFAKDLFRFMNKLGIERAVLCGMSMGGYIALSGLLEQPDRIASLVLCCTQCKEDTPEAKKKRFDAIHDIRINGLEDYAHQAVQRLFSDSSLADKREEVFFIDKMIKETNVETVCNTLIAMANRVETCSTLYLVDIPVLFIAGEEDKIITLDTMRQMHESMPHSILRIVKGAGHMCNLESPTVFNRYVEEFLKDQSDQGATERGEE